MLEKLNLGNIATYPRLCTRVLGCNPLPRNASRRDYLKQQFAWWCSMSIAVFGILSLIWAIYEDTTDIDMILRTIPEMTLLSAQIGKQLACKIYHDSIRDILEEFDKYLREASCDEVAFIQGELKYVYVVYLVFIIGCVVDPMTFVLAPFVSSRTLPAHGRYPWSLDPPLVHAAIYIQQSVCAGTTSCMACMDVLYGSLLWCAIVRFRYLSKEISTAQDELQVRKYAEILQKLTSYSTNVADIVRWMGLVIVMEILSMVTTGGVLLLRQPPLEDYINFSLMICDGAAELMVFAWAADNLCSAFDDIRDAAFQCEWYGKPTEIALNLRLIMQRCQLPVTISSPGLLPVLSREFFGTIMSTTFSYIATLRAVAS